ARAVRATSAAIGQATNIVASDGACLSPVARSNRFGGGSAARPCGRPVRAGCRRIVGCGCRASRSGSCAPDRSLSRLAGHGSYQRRSRWRLAGNPCRTGCAGAGVAGRGGRADAPDRARLYPCPAGGADHRRSGGCRTGGAHPYRRGPELSPTAANEL
ncbi:hypothetical protein LTR94_031203, partial [Friedmanniomyces endolithicus]